MDRMAALVAVAHLMETKQQEPGVLAIRPLHLPRRAAQEVQEATPSIPALAVVAAHRLLAAVELLQSAATVEMVRRHQFLGRL